MITVLVLLLGFTLGCASAEVSKAPQRKVGEKQFSDAKQNTADPEREESTDRDIEMDDTDSDSKLKDDKNNEGSAADSDSEKPAPEVDGTEVNDKKAKVSNPNEKRTALAITSLRREDDDIVIQVKLPGGEWKSIPWPEQELNATVGDICAEGKDTEIEFQIEHPGEGTITTAGPDIGMRKTGVNSVEIGYESRGGCSGTGCQDDNIVTFTCTSGLKIKGLK